MDQSPNVLSATCGLSAFVFHCLVNGKDTSGAGRSKFGQTVKYLSLARPVEHPRSRGCLTGRPMIEETDEQGPREGKSNSVPTPKTRGDQAL
jgi:hypothetical protein